MSGVPASKGYLQTAWERFRRDRISLAALVGFALIGIVTVVVPWALTTFLGLDPDRQQLAQALRPPSAAHWLGTDNFGRDNLTRVLYGGRVSLLVGFIVAAVSLSIGTVVGMVSGYFGGWVDDVSNAIIQMMLNIPSLFLLILLSVTFRPDVIGLAVFIGVLGWMGVARQVRGLTLALKEQTFVEAARVLGGSNVRVMLRHILPNLLSIILVVTAFEVAAGILVESGLSYLGLGVQVPTPSWGNMLTNSLSDIQRAWWLVAAPGVAIFLTILCIFLIADGLRDALDPSLKE